MIYIIIPVFNRLEFTKACLQALDDQTVRGFSTIVVDDGSTDGTFDYISENFPDVILLKGDGDLWWTGATNMGIEYALRQNDCSFILTLNNDTLPMPDFIENMLEGSREKPGALLGALAVDAETDLPIYAGEIMLWAKEKSNFLLSSGIDVNAVRFAEVSHFPGRGLLIPKEVFDKIGPFDGKYFRHYLADYDFTLRAVKAGYHIYCNYGARLKVYMEASGANQLMRKKTLKNYRGHLFGLKGGGNLPLFVRFAWRHCPPYALPSYLTLGVLRRIIGYWVH